jgi:hypothetical protein
MIRGVAMMAWERKHPLGPNVLFADIKFPNKEPQQDKHYAIHQGYVRTLRDSIIKGIWETVPQPQPGKEEAPAKF